MSDCGSSPSYSGLADGTYTYTVTATDAQSLVATFTTRFTVDTVAPTATLAVPTSLTGPATVRWSEDVTGLTAGTATLAVTDSNATVTAKATCFSATGAAVSCSGAYHTLKLTPTRALVPGQYYTLAADDGAGTDRATNASALNARVFRAARVVEETTPAARSTWQKVATRSAYGSSYVREHLAGARESWTFRGSAITWYTVTGPTQGTARVLIDGHVKRTINNYAASTHYRVARTIRGLGARRHVITIVVTGLKGSKSGKGTFVAVDAFKVGTKRTNNPGVQATWHRIAGSRLFGRHAAAGGRQHHRIKHALEGVARPHRAFAVGDIVKQPGL